MVINRCEILFITFFKGGTISETLNYVELGVISNSKCAEIYGDGTLIEPLICAQGPPDHPNAGSCYGDSGGPLVLNENETYTQIGVMSFRTDRGCETDRPTVFVRTASFLNWISVHTGAVIRK